ncbi:unnamed protein product [Hydatigera taeniaeformis]|uniref:Transmembrane protein n=1 Tax=Hydatigena taeniaeformis TaxID=6205 RepID=A0A0R3X2B7_HYDTA|nr:unnamed protein product [Hydatigera taeniaeformis]
MARPNEINIATSSEGTNVHKFFSKNALTDMSIQQGEKVEQATPSSPTESKSTVKTTSLHCKSHFSPEVVEYSSNGVRSSIRFDLPLSSPSSFSSLSTLTSISGLSNGNVKDSTAVHPSANLKFLRSVHKRTKRKRRLRKCLRIFHYIFVYGLPIGGVILGIAGILLGHFLRIEPIFVGSCLLLITAFGLMLQSCFWKRSLPNKFRPKEIPFNMPQDDSLVSRSNDPFDHETDKSAGSDTSEQPVKSPAMDPAQVRRLSMALNRATAELSAARQITSVTGAGSGVLNLARRLTMGPMQFGDYSGMRELESGNGWIAGRFPQGVRRGLAWNDTGASRFYASNYD